MEIRFLAIETANFAETVHFYRRTLEVAVLSEGPGYAVLHLGNSQLLLRQALQGQPFYHLAFDIPQNQLSQAAQWLERRVPLLERHGEREVFFEDWNATSVYFHDPSDNIVELIARHNLANDRAQAFDADSLLSVSEIGWPSQDPARTSQEMGIEAWRDYGPFKALGSESGLILLVPIGRGWLPTDRPAESHPCEVLVQTSAGYHRFSV